ncbi:hypothetical protein BWQ96_01503 [Gracilariopsis chorda]|uniref:CAP N-terminal domain-containing protein n=1 Tax=Gracilariopsis chorda TaxID=448386 RepID=A0A2V3J2I0_9FLOR|nr:hypothetical protein BWQ96_01503 [Gracilariopsis chorda]|eukprot:PXF48651.1 hypothetical protein BWQ96_01503 [Gracilariopsis chorda]
MATTVNPEGVIDILERKLRALEEYAVKYRLGGNPLPPYQPRVFRSDRALNNAIEASLVRIENVADYLPRVVATGRSHIQAKVIDYDPGELFLKQMAPPVQQLKKAAEGIALLGKEFGKPCTIVLEQTNLFEASVKAEGALVSRASKMAKPSDPAVFKAECEDLVDKSADAAELKYDIDARSPLHNHTMALADVAAALGWVVAPTPLKHARDYKVIVNNLAEDILSRYIDLGCNPIHSDFAEALNAIMDVLVKYVEKEHPAGLRWNYAQGSTPLGYRRAKRILRKDSHPIGDFYQLMHSGLTEFILLSRELGGVLTSISAYTQSTYEEMAKMVETASKRKRPRSDVEAALRMLLVSVQHELGPLVSTLERVPEDDKYARHCQVLREFVNCLLWCTATLQKMSPVGYIIDVENITLVYLDKLERDICVDEGYISRLHRSWINSVRKMLTEMKEYVKLHHPNELMFDTQRSRKSIDGLIASVALTNQLEELREKSNTKKWVRGAKEKMVLGGVRRMVQTWITS